MDATKDCVTWKRKGYCDASHRYYNYMKKNCKKTCEYCGKGNKLMDHVAQLKNTTSGKGKTGIISKLVELDGPMLLLNAF